MQGLFSKNRAVRRRMHELHNLDHAELAKYNWTDLGKISPACKVFRCRL